jgi:hypothetical protein
MRLPGYAFVVIVALGIASGTADAVTVSVAPADTTVTVGADFTLRVVTDAITDLKAYHLYYDFASATITSSGVDPGDVLTGAGGTFSAFAFPDNTLPTGTILYDAAMLTGTSQGPGILGFFKFHAVAIGTSPIQCVPMDAQNLPTPNFRDSGNNQILPACVGGLVHVTGPVPARTATWGHIKQVYR